MVASGMRDMGGRTLKPLQRQFQRGMKIKHMREMRGRKERAGIDRRVDRAGRCAASGCHARDDAMTGACASIASILSGSSAMVRIGRARPVRPV
jgi:hypothetical protein